MTETAFAERLTLRRGPELGNVAQKTVNGLRNGKPCSLELALIVEAEVDGALKAEDLNLTPAARSAIEVWRPIAEEEACGA